jgi:uracil-DNA glycosylase family 4
MTGGFARLPLYPGGAEGVLLEGEAPLSPDPACGRCALGAGARNRCLQAAGDAPGGLLVIGDFPTREEDASGRIFAGHAGQYVRRRIAEAWRGPVVYDYAVRCSPGGKDVPPAASDACRGYLSRTLIEVQPSRILCFGPLAARGVLGRSPSAWATRRGYAYTGDGVPVFLLPSPAMPLRNRFLRQWFEADVLWALTADPPLPPLRGAALLVRTVAEAEEAVAVLRGAREVAWDLETAGIMFSPSFRIVAAAFSADGTDAYVWTREACASPAVRAPLVAYLVDASTRKGGANIKFDMAAVASAWGVMPRGISFDVRLWRKLQDTEADGKLAAMAELVGMGGHKEEAQDARDATVKRVRAVLAGEAKRRAWVEAFGDAPTALVRGPSGKTTRRKAPEAPPPLSSLGIDPALEVAVRTPDAAPDSWVYGLLPDDVLYRYNARDAVSTRRLEAVLRARFSERPDLRRVWDKVVSGANEAVAQVETWGVAVDRDALDLFDNYLTIREREVGDILRGYADILWSSPDQVAEYLYGKLGLRPPKQTKTGKDSTDEEALSALRGHHGCIDHLLQYRQVTKLRGTYADGMRWYIRPDGRIHPSILLDGADTGRTSCRDPNLQNIPSEKNDPDGGPYYGRMARDVFVAPPGYLLLQLDYSQLELRVAAVLSGDEEMLSIFAAGVDYHMRTAELIAPVAWGVPPEKWESLPTHEKKRFRSFAKTINFGLLYGKGDGTIAREFGCKVEEAARIRAAILGRFKRFARWCADRLSESRKTGVSRTWWEGEPARERALWQIGDPDDARRNRAENGAVNGPIQGTASDYCIASLVESVRWLREDAVPARLVLPIHDALLFEVRADAVDEVYHGVRRIMTSWDSAGVPLEVDADVGRAWGSLKGYKGGPLPEGVSA